MSVTSTKFERIHITTLAVLCLSIAASIGLVINIGGLFLTPMAEELGTGRGNVSITMSICNIIYAIGGMVLPRVIRVENFKKVITIGALVTVIGTFSLSFAQSLWQLYLLNAIRGFSSGFVSTVLANIIVNKWFLKNTGFISSIVMSFSGLAGALFSPLFGVFLKNYGWRMSYRIAAGMMLVFFLPYLLAKVNLVPEAVGAHPYGGKTEQVKENKAAAEKLPKKIFVLLLVFGAVTGFNNTMIQHFPGLAEANGLTIGSLMLSAAMVSNTGSKLLIGAMIDRFGVRKSVIGMAVFVSVGFLLCMVVSKATYLLGAVILGFGYSVSTVGVSMLTRDVAGAQRYGSVYPVAAMVTTSFYAMGTSLVGYIYDFCGSYTPVLMCYLAMEIVVILLTVVSGKLKEA